MVNPFCFETAAFWVSKATNRLYQPRTFKKEKEKSEIFSFLHISVRMRDTNLSTDTNGYAGTKLSITHFSVRLTPNRLLATGIFVRLYIALFTFLLDVYFLIFGVYYYFNNQLYPILIAIGIKSFFTSIRGSSFIVS